MAASVQVVLVELASQVWSVKVVEAVVVVAVELLLQVELVPGVGGVLLHPRLLMVKM